MVCISIGELDMRSNWTRGILSRIDRFAGTVDKATLVICVALGGGMVGVLISGVIARYIMQNPMVWTEEIARALMIWTALLGISIVARRRSHLGVVLLMVRLPMSWQRFVKLFTDGLSMWFLCVLTVYGVRMVESAKTQIETATGISMSYFFICVPICGLLTMIQLAVVMLIDLSRWGTPISPYNKESNT
jgi:TRAP-type C4-dicarboxylate transport system permease small subunit